MGVSTDFIPADREQMFPYFKQLLHKQLTELLTGLQNVSFDRGDAAEFTADLLDQAAKDRDRGIIERIRSREGRLIQKIEDALARIEDGTYGICECCGEEIDLARLNARPMTTYCIECKIALEKMERVSG